MISAPPVHPAGQRAGEAQCIGADLEIIDLVPVIAAFEHEGVGAGIAEDPVIAIAGKYPVVGHRRQ